MEKVHKECLASQAEFDQHYEGCPYAHQPTEVPEDVKAVLMSTTVGGG